MPRILYLEKLLRICNIFAKQNIDEMMIKKKNVRNPLIDLINLDPLQPSIKTVYSEQMACIG